ncbi:MAG: multicopper oxidase family protein [Pikeienuella sp.]
METKIYNLMIKPTVWDFGASIGEQHVICYHQFIDADGNVVGLDDASGEWVPFIPAPTIRGNVGDTVHVRVMNRIGDPGEGFDAANFVDELKMETMVHWHGVELSNAHDGTPVTQRTIHTGEEFVYKFQLVRPGVFWYHPHWDGLIQEHLGAYGPIIVEDTATDTLRAELEIPHEDRTWNICLSDVSFQDGPAIDPPDDHVAVADIDPTVDYFIRNIHHIGGGAGAENFGDVLLINGHHEAPFNSASGNFQQFWESGDRTTAGVFEVGQNESMAFHLLNTGLHRYYKIELVFKEDSADDWSVSEDLVWIGGQGGLLDVARTSAGADQAVHSLNDGQFLLPTASRITLAFKAQSDWSDVGLRVSGADVTGGTTADTDPTDMVIAQFTVSAVTDPAYELNADLVDGTPLRNHADVADALEDLSAEAVETESDCTSAQLSTAGAVVPAALTTTYDMDLGNFAGTPNISGDSVHWHDMGPGQPTADNTRYVELDDVTEWTISNSTGASHPWHTHGFSFQPISLDVTGAANVFTWDFVEYVDVMNVPSGHTLTYRMKIEDRNYVTELDEDGANDTDTGGVVGRWLAHCHITKHAHNGMMMNFIAVNDCNTFTHQHVDVWLKDHTDDTGEEGHGLGISASPDICIHQTEEAPADAFAGATATTAEYGQDNYIYARVRNRGNQPAIAATDIYWSPASTLITPDTWRYIGRTEEHQVDAGSESVSEPLAWNPAHETEDLNADVGHYCFVAVTGSQQDMRPVSTIDAEHYLDFGGDFDNFRALIRDNNNVTWRNFNVVDVDPSNELTEAEAAEKKARFDMRGAFDRDRVFDLVINNPFVSMVMELPNDGRLRKALDLQKIPYEPLKRSLQVYVAAKSTVTIRNLKLTRSKAYPICFEVRDKAADVIGNEVYVAQVWVEDYQDQIAKVREQIRVAEAADVQALGQELKRLTQLAANLDEAPREEVGRVTWAYVAAKPVVEEIKPEEEVKPDCPEPPRPCWLCRVLNAIFGCDSR